MDRDGVTREVLYHFSTNGEPFPFMMQVAGGLTNDQSDLELATVGYHLYNEWLADWVSVDSQRLLGLAYIPIWDIDLAVKEVEWAASRGLHGVNFPPPGRPDTILYNDPDWDPFWAACVANDMPLNTHSSGGQPIDYSGPGGINVQVYEGGGWLSRRAVWWLDPRAGVRALPRPASSSSPSSSRVGTADDARARRDLPALRHRARRAHAFRGSRASTSRRTCSSARASCRRGRRRTRPATGTRATCSGDATTRTPKACSNTSTIPTRNP